MRVAGYIWLLVVALFAGDVWAVSLKASDVSPWQLHQHWKMIRDVLRRDPQLTSLRRAWKEVHGTKIRAVLRRPGGVVTPGWLVDARAGTIVLNLTELDSLRRRFNIYVARKKRAFRRYDRLDMTGAWQGVWPAVQTKQLTARGLSLIFALKIFPAVSYAIKRASLQNKMRALAGVTFPDETFEEMLLALAYQRLLMTSILQNRDTRALWMALSWNTIDRPMKRLLHVPKGLTPNQQLVRHAMTLSRRTICFFCPLYSAYPTNDVLQINLVRGGSVFFLNRSRYRSLLFQSPDDAAAYYRTAVRMGSAYLRAFARALKAKGPKAQRMRRMFEENLLSDQVRRQQLFLHAAWRIAKQPATYNKCTLFYKRQLKRQLGLSVQRIKSIGRSLEKEWLQKMLSSFHFFAHPTSQ
jgi:hypothetical protein